MTTRLPINDPEEHFKKPPLLRSYSPLEDKIFAAVDGKYLSRCTRGQIVLSDALVAVAPPAVAEKRNILYRLYGGASYLRYTAGYTGVGRDGWRKPKHEMTTAAYMIFEPEIWPDGPDLLLGFGMDGVVTQGWMHIVRERFPELVGVEGFTMAEIILTQLPDTFSDLSFTDEWQVTLLSGATPIRVRQPKLVAES